MPFFIKSNILHLCQHHFKTLFKPWSDLDDSIPFPPAAVSMRLFNFVSKRRQCALVFNFIALPVFSPSLTLFHFDLLFFIRSHSHFMCRADNEVMFGEEVQKKRYEWQNSSLLASANTVFISAVMITWQVQVTSTRRVSLSVLASIPEGNTSSQANTIPGFSWVLQNTSLCSLSTGICWAH